MGCARPLASYRYMSEVRWQRGDVDRLAPLLHLEVELIWWGPGEWDCHGRETVLSMLRGRVGKGARAALIEAGEGAIVAARAQTVPDGPAAGLRLATSLVSATDWRSRCASSAIERSVGCGPMTKKLNQPHSDSPANMGSAEVLR